MSLAGKNLRHLRKSRGLTQDEFASQLGIKRSLVGAYEEERADPRIDVLELVMEMYNLSLDDLLLQDLSQAGESYLSKRRRIKMADEPRTTIRFVPFKAAAGYLSGYNDPEFVDELNTFALPMLAAGDYRAFEILGDSMLPTPSGSVVVGEKIEDLDALKNDQPCIVVSRMEGIVYKRVNKSPRSKNMRQIVEKVLKQRPEEHFLLNVNIPKVPFELLNGIKVCRQAYAKYREEFDERRDPQGRNYYWLTGEFMNMDTGEDTDVWALQHNYVSVVPVSIDFTDHRTRNQLQELWNDK